LIIAASVWYLLDVNRSPPAEAARLSSVVLPVTNLSGDASQDFFRGRVDRPVDYIHLLRGGIALNSSQMNVYQGPCRANLNTGQHEEVIALFDKAIQLSPRDSLSSKLCGERRAATATPYS
jgi:hypothetical protein